MLVQIQQGVSLIFYFGSNYIIHSLIFSIHLTFSKISSVMVKSVYTFDLGSNALRRERSSRSH